MNPDVRKVLSRACARFKTGIRTMFALDGHSARLDMPSGVAVDAAGNVVNPQAVLIVWSPEGGPYGTFAFVMDLTPEGVFRAYLESQVADVHRR